MITAINPATGQTIESYEEVAPNEAAHRIDQAHQQFLLWRRSSFAERAQPMKAAAAVLRRSAAEFARLMALEMGKPVTQGRAEVEKCAWLCEYYADNAESFLQPELIPTDARRSAVYFEPLGVLLAVMPWNFPFWQVFRAAVPALMAGNAVVLKHASNVPGCALALERIFREAGFPAGLFTTLLMGSRAVSALIDHPLVRAVTLTGSTPAGRAVAAAAGAALKKTVLELGGSDPYLVLEDADLEQAAETCAASRLINTGQSCIAAKRFIVVETVLQRFETLFIAAMAKRVCGDPLQDSTSLGPMARADLRDQLHDQVQRALAAGARLCLGGAIPDGLGAFYPSTVLGDVRPGMPAFDEETFGPVAAIVPGRDEGEAIQLANNSCFGLGAAVFTRDLARGERIAARELEAGCCFVNDFVRSDPRLPFGGLKQAGYGREIATVGIREFVNIKTVYVK
jgi:succinate-semialdehyde dehydrogenase/glutarate-semialdehyde dehydrogenase